MYVYIHYDIHYNTIFDVIISVENTDLTQKKNLPPVISERKKSYFWPGIDFNTNNKVLTQTEIRVIKVCTYT